MDRRQITDDGDVWVYNVDVPQKGSFFEVEIEGGGGEAMITSDEAVRLRDALNEWLEEKGIE